MSDLKVIMLAAATVNDRTNFCFLNFALRAITLKWQESKTEETQFPRQWGDFGTKFW
jgi:hypothetical protein